MEGVPLLAAVAPITMRTASAGAVFQRAQRAQIVRDALRQHRHDAVGEIDRVAALQRLAVERRAGAHIEAATSAMATVTMIAARVVGILVRRGMDRVVMVLGVGGIDGDERQRAPILAARQRRRARRLRPLRARPAELMRDAMGVDRDQADGASRT